MFKTEMNHEFNKERIKGGGEDMFKSTIIVKIEVYSKCSRI